MIRLECPNCRASLTAKDSLLGQTRRCPVCKSEVLITQSQEGGSSGGSNALSATQSAEAPPRGEIAGGQPRLSLVELPPRLDRAHYYLICDRWRVIAAWESNGQGWRIRTDYGFVSAARNPEKLPNQGDFQLVELRMAEGPQGHSLRGIRVYQLAKRWALTHLERGDDAICKSILGPGSLLRAQKDAIRQHLQQQFMRDVWGNAAEVLDYLANDDYHSPGAGD